MRDAGYGLCECGCGQQTRLAYRTDSARGWVKGQPMRFIHRHRLPPVLNGAANPRFSGGLGLHSDGRCYVTCRDGSRIAYSRAVMAANVGRLLESSEIVHHEDEDPTNDDLGNLKIVTRAAHLRIHLPAILAARGL
jgi:hypothetical protein